MRWPTAPAHALDAACASLADVLEGQWPSRQGVTDRAREEFRGNKAEDFALRLTTNARNAEGLVANLHAMRAALAAAADWALAEQAARVKARQEEDDRRWFGLKALLNDFVG